MPLDLFSRVLKDRGVERLDFQTAGLRTNDRRRAAIGEHEKRQELVEVARLLQVQSAQLEVDHENASFRVGFDDVIGGLQAVDGRKAPHEADERALDVRSNLEMVDDLKVEPRLIKAGTARHHHVTDIGHLRLKLLDGLTGETKGELLVQLHSRLSGRKAPPPEVPFGIDAVGVWGWLQKAVAPLDLGAPGHAVKHSTLAFA